MYDALAREQLHLQQDELRRRLEAAARLPRPWELESQPCDKAHRRWWPRPHRLAVR